MRTTHPRWVATLAICLLGLGVMSGVSVANGSHGTSVTPLGTYPRYCAAGCPHAHAKDAADCDLAKEAACMKDKCHPCGPPGRHWVRAEYLGWWISGAEAPPLITISPEGTLREDAGVIGTPGTEILFGGGRLNRDMHSGFRLRMGSWLDCDRKHGLEGSFFLLAPNSDSASAGLGDGSLIVGRPFIDANTCQNEAQLVEYSELLAGRVDARSRTSLLGAEVLGRFNMFCDPYCCYDPYSKPFADHTLDYQHRACVRQDLLVGFRYLNLSDRVTIRESLEVLDAAALEIPVADGTRFDIEDQFRTTNNFYGLKLGFDYLRHHGRWSLEARPQVSLGVVDRRISIRGQRLVTSVDGSISETTGGLLALSSNIGDYCSSQWTLVPELDLSVGYLIRPRTRLLVGYSCLYLPGVAWAGQQIDPVVNPELIPPPADPITGPQRPAYLGRWSSAWVQGVTAGVEYRW